MTLGINMIVQLQNSFHLKLKTKTKKIWKIIYTNVTEDLYVKKKIYRIINITVAENTENVYHNTRQNLNFTHTPQNKKTKIKTSS